MSLIPKLVPRSQRDWVSAYIAESKVAERRASWGISTPIVVIVAWLLWLKGAEMKTVVLTLSTINLLAGVSVISIWATSDGHPPVMLLVGCAVCAQGVYTMVYSTGWLESAEPWARTVLLVGSTMALLVGIGGLLAGALYNLAPGTVDPEYGPMTMAGLIAALAIAAVLAYALEPRQDKL